MTPTDREIYEFGEFRLDVPERLLLRSDVPVSLPDKAFEILRLLVRRSGHLVEKSEILNTVWADAFVEENNLDKNISILRRALGEKKNGNRYIETIRGHGYRFVAEVTIGKPSEAATTGSEITNHRSEAQPGLLHVQRSGNVLALADWPRIVEDESVDLRDGEANRFPRRQSPKKGRAWTISAAIILPLVLGGLLANYFFGHRAQNISAALPFETFKIKRYSDNGSFNPAVVSADGKFIAFTDNKYAVWLKNTVTDSSVRILPDIDIAERSIIGFSPDDSYIYFRYVPKEKRSEILKIAVFGGAISQKIAEDSWSQPTLSPDGRQIAFTRFNAETKVFSLIAAETDGTGERTIVENKVNERFDNWVQSTAWSPNSLDIASIGRSETEQGTAHFIQLFRVADGSEMSRIQPSPDMNSMQAVAWLPDGENLLVIGNDQASQGQIYRYTIRSETWKRLTNDLSDYLNLSIAADGKTILTTISNNQSNLWVVPGGDAALARQITTGFNSIYDSSGVSWTSDGRIVYATNVTGHWEIWMIDTDGSNQRQLTQNCAGNDLCVMPFASPDGRFIVFQASRGGEYNIWRMDADGASATQLTFGGGSMSFVTADSRYVMFVKKKGSSSTLWKVSIEGGSPEQVTPIAPIYLGSLSPDGKMLAFIYYDQSARQPFETCVAGIDANRPEKCFDKSRAFPVWTQDGKAFYSLGHDYSGIWRQSLDGGREKVLEFSGDRTNTFAISADGKNFVVARSRPTQDIVALVDGQ